MLLVWTVVSIGLVNFILLALKKNTPRQRPAGMVRVLRLVPGRLAEYEVSGAPFDVRLWLNLTAVLTLLLFWLGLHTQENWVLLSLLIGLSVALLAKLHLKVKRETLLVESSLGVQLTTTFASGRQSSLFIQRGRLSDVVVAEAITMHRVVSYLAIVLREPPRLVPLFRHTWPRIAQLRDMYRGIQPILRPEGCLVGPADGHGGCLSS